jgi:hypothetical protein
MMRKAVPRFHTLSLSGSWFAGLLACAVLGGLYFYTRTEVHTFDALSYTWGVEDKPLGLLFHPHHLLYGPVGWLAYKGALALGYAGHADVPVQVVNAVAGAAGVFFLWRFGARWTGRPTAALGASLATGLSYAYWVYASEVEVYTLATAFLSLALWKLIKLDERPRATTAMSLGLAHAGAILFHQTNVLFGLAMASFLLSRPRLRRWTIILPYGAAVVLPIAAAYGYVAYASNFPDWTAFYSWLTDYARTGQWGRFLSIEHFPALRSGLLTSVSTRSWLATSFFLLTIGGIVAGSYQAWRNPVRRPWHVFASVWSISYLFFFWWWEPWNIEFWIALLPLWNLWIISAWPPIINGAAGRSRSVPDQRSATMAIYALLPFVAAVLMFWAHFESIEEMGDASADYYRQVTDALAQVAQPEELVVSRGNVLDLYIPFYAGHPLILSMRLLEQQYGGDRDQLMDELVGRLDWATVTGQPFLIDQFILDEAREPVRNPFGLLTEEIGRIRDRYVLEPLAFRGEQPLFYGTPRFNDVSRTAWRFVESLQGWSSWGIDGPRFEKDGWCFTGGIDPQLKGPPIRIDAGTWTQLALDLTIDAASSRAQVFWRSSDGDYSLENPLDVELHRGREVYRVKLSEAPGWRNSIVQIRVDPVPGKDASSTPVNACVHGIWFEKSGP